MGLWSLQISYLEQSLKNLTMLHSVETMEREEHKNISFLATSSYPPLEYNPPTSPGNSPAKFMVQGRLPH
jgi:hypothetical protein